MSVSRKCFLLQLAILAFAISTLASKFNGKATVGESPLKTAGETKAGYGNTSTSIHIQVTAIFVDKAEFPLSKLLFKLTLKLATAAAERRLNPSRARLSLNIRSANTCSRQYAGALAAEEYYLRKTRLFIVSGCDDAVRSVSRLASTWRVPTMTATTFGPEMDRKSIHRTLTKMAFSLKTAVEFLVKILKSFSWHRINILVDESDINSLRLKEAIGKHMSRLASSNFSLTLNTIGLDLGSLAAGSGQASSRAERSTNATLKVDNTDTWPNRNMDRAIQDALRQVAAFSRVTILLFPQQYLRKFMLSVYDQNMANGMYTFINLPLLFVASQEDQLDSLQEANNSRQSYSLSAGENIFVWRSLTSSRNAHARRAFESLMSIYLRIPTTKAYIYFAGKILEMASSAYSTTRTAASSSFVMPFNQRNSSKETSGRVQLSVNPYSASFYDSIQVYATALNESLARIDSEPNVTFKSELTQSLHSRLSDLLRNRRYDNLVSGNIYINENGERETDYTLDDLNQLTGKYQPVILFKGETKEIERLSRIQWSTDETVGPTVDNVDCRLTNTCPSKPVSKFLVTLTLVSLPLALVVGAILYFVYSRISLESQLVDYWWKLSMKDIEIQAARRKAAGSSLVTAITSSLQLANQSDKKSDVDTNTDLSSSRVANRNEVNSAASTTNVTKVTNASTIPASAADVCYGGIVLGLYKLSKVALKPISKFHQSRRLMIELRTIRSISHSNLCRFVGILLDESCNALVAEFCPKGSLREFFQNESMVIDKTFKYSIINDIVAGLVYLHSSAIGFHGRLKASNCLVSARFVVKLSDYGLCSLHESLDGKLDECDLYKKRIWSAPEHLKCSSYFSGSAKGDVYSLGLLLYEVVTTKIPFFNAEKSDFILPLKQLYQELRSVGLTEKTGPDLSAFEVGDAEFRPLVDLMKRCWTFNPDKRPSLMVVQGALKRITRGVTSKKLLENLTTRMEQYTNNLESFVEAKLATLMEEKLNTEALLYQFVPKSIALLLKEGQSVEPEAFDCVTVFYSDIVGFTSLSSISTPIEVIDFLSSLYQCFDEILEQYDIFKVETIGDAYIVASGLPQRNGDKHALEIARAALALRDRLSSFRIQHKPDRMLEMRVGIHSGPCVAGIVGGSDMPKYCVFGDTLSIGKFMEGSGLPMKIHLTEQSKNLLSAGFDIEPRVPKITKDGQPLQTYWLENKSN